MKRILFFLALLIGEIAASERGLNVSFAGIFDEGIYDQTPISKSNCTECASSRGEDRIITHPIEILKMRKERQLTEKYLSVLKEKIRGFQRAIGQEGEITEGFDRILEDFRRNPFAALTSTLFTISSWCEGLFGRPKEKRWGEKGLANAKSADNSHLEFEILKIRAEMKAAYESLQFETVLPLEECYVQKKSFLSVPLQTAIERSLILYRECSGHLLAIERTFVEQALSLPIEPRRILLSGQEANEIRTLIEKTKGKFSTFSDDIQQELIRIVVDIANFSMTTSDYDGARRVVRYFWGKPGGGKTTSVQVLAEEIVGLPVEKISIRSMEDLSGPPLRGEDRLSYSSGNKHGWFISPLLQKVVVYNESELAIDTKGQVIRKTYNNAILLIDDIDLELGADEVLSTLKLYLDPTTRIFHSPYFASPIDVSRMHVFVTSNQKIPEAPIDISVVDKYAALRSRVKQVHFPIFGITEESPVLKAYVEKEAKIRSIIFLDHNAEISLSIRIAKAALTSVGEEPDMRNMRATIADLMTEVQIACICETLSVKAILERKLQKLNT